MFSSLKGFTSNINSSYSVSPTPSSTAGAWKIYDAKKKSTQKPYSVFVFDRKSLDSHGKRHHMRTLLHRVAQDRR